MVADSAVLEDDNAASSIDQPEPHSAANERVSPTKMPKTAIPKTPRQPKFNFKIEGMIYSLEWRCDLKLIHLFLFNLNIIMFFEKIKPGQWVISGSLVSGYNSLGKVKSNV